MPFTLIRNDITTMSVDAIVNAANIHLEMGGGVCGAIFQAAGARDLQLACRALAPIKTGEAVMTSGFALPAKHIIHAAGPVYRHWRPEQNERYLRAAYINSLKRAAEEGCRSVAFPLISGGIYGYPKAEALKVATAAIRDFLAGCESPAEGRDMDVFLVVFDKEAFVVSEGLLGEVTSYIDEHYVREEERRDSRYPSGAECLEERSLKEGSPEELSETGLFSEIHEGPSGAVMDEAPAPARVKALRKLSPPGVFFGDIIENLDEPFSQTLLRLIDAKGKTDVEVYKRANLDRKLFSKIRTGKEYTPSKKTALALAVALELDLDETGDLLKRAGYALSHSQKFDVIIEYFITHNKHDIFEINEVLFSYDQPLLGG